MTKKSGLRVLLFTVPAEFTGKSAKKRFFAYQPLGLLYIASALRTFADFECDLKVIDGYTFGYNREQIRSKIAAFKPDIVGVSAVTLQIMGAQEIFAIARQVDPSIITVLGGPHVSSYPIEAAKEKNTDIAVIGEGEYIFVELCRAVYHGNDWKKVDGIAFSLQNGEVECTKNVGMLHKLDELPDPDFDFLPDIDNYNPMPHHSRSGHFAAMVTSRGCPFSCSYCSVTTIQGRRYRFRSPENVVREIKHLYHNKGVRNLSFRDGTFTTNKKRVFAICNLIMEEGLEIRWNCTCRGDEVDQAVLALMKKAGCFSISLGVEQGNAELIKKYKHTTKEKIIQAARLAKEAGIDVHGFFMLGMPEETMSTLRETIDFAKSLPLSTASFFIFCPLPGTEIWNECKKKNLLLNKEWSHFNQAELVWKHPNLTETQLLRMQKRATREFFLRPGILFKRLKRISSFKDLANNIVVGIKLLKKGIA